LYIYAQDSGRFGLVYITKGAESTHSNYRWNPNNAEMKFTKRDMSKDFSKNFAQWQILVVTFDNFRLRV
jgi:hypothetical protein